MVSQISLEELVTSTPVQNLDNLYSELTLFHRHFMYIDSVLRDLKKDKCANRLQSLFMPFNESMDTVLCEMHYTLRRAGRYYADDHERLGGQDLINVKTEQDVRLLLDEITRGKQIYHGSFLLKSLEEAIPMLKDLALPSLPEIEMELKDFVERYRERYDATQQSAQSWVPTAVQNLVWGSFEPTTEDISKIEALPEHFENVTRYLQKIPKFLEDLRDHLQRMMSLSRTDYETLGYSSVEGFKRLYANRAQCSYLFRGMSNSAGNLVLPFIWGKGIKWGKYITSRSKWDKDITPSSKFRKDI
jgi:hypothetical protein